MESQITPAMEAAYDKADVAWNRAKGMARRARSVAYPATDPNPMRLADIARIVKAHRARELAWAPIHRLIHGREYQPKPCNPGHAV